jgi:hypothetical protein
MKSILGAYKNDDAFRAEACGDYTGDDDNTEEMSSFDAPCYEMARLLVVWYPGSREQGVLATEMTTVDYIVDSRSQSKEFPFNDMAIFESPASKRQFIANLLNEIDPRRISINYSISKVPNLDTPTRK